MSSKTPINLSGSANLQPVPQFVATVLNGAVRNKADEIIFELNPELHGKEEAKRIAERDAWTAALLSGKNSELSASVPNALDAAFTITRKSGDEKHQLTPPPSDLFEPIMRVLLAAAEISYWAKGFASGEIETVNPKSKWRLESEDVTRLVVLKKV